MSDKNRKVGCVQICIVDYQYDFFSNPCEWDCFERHIFWLNNMIIRQHPSLRSPPVGGKDLTKLWPLCPPGIEIVIWFRYQLFFSKKKSLGAGCPWHPAQYYRPRNSILHRSSSAIQKHPWPQFVGFVGFWASPSCRRVQPHPVEKSCSTKWVCKRFPPRFRIY